MVNHKTLCQKICLGLIAAYQYCLSPLLQSRCRFYPSCSEYATQAISRFGVLKGGWLTLKRLCRCQPCASGGYDPVPEPGEDKHHVR